MRTSARHFPLDATISVLARTSSLPVVFVGTVDDGGVRVVSTSGMRTNAFSELVVPARAGLGGHVVVSRSPVRVAEYARSRSITHEFDDVVAAEELRALVAVPVLVRQRVRAVLYGALRYEAVIADRAVGEIVRCGDRLAHDIDAAEPDRQPLATLRSVVMAGAAPGMLTGPEIEEVRRAFARLRTLAAQAEDHTEQNRLRGLCERFAQLGRSGTAMLPPGHDALGEREIDVLALAGTGLRNGEIAEMLSVSLETVKSYLRSAMQKLGVHSRFDAVLRAREQGDLP
jgi:DNA-binding CsgD family transcriptional regulator